MCMGWCTEEGTSGSMQCVWKEGLCELNPLCNMWLLSARVMFDSAKSLARVPQGFVCKMCRGGGRKAADEFCFEDVKLECVGEFAYLGDMLNATNGMEQAVATRMKAACMKFGELGGILCLQRTSLRMKGVVYKVCVHSVLTYGAETWAMRGMFQRL